MKGKPGEPPFEEYIVYGPIFHRKEKRRMIVLVRKDKSRRTSTSYARYLMCVKLGRMLCKDEEVDHKDDDKMNDDVSNLQVLTFKQNLEKSCSKRVKTTVELVCDHCKGTFGRRKGNEPSAKGYKRAFCNRECRRLFLKKAP